MRSPQTLALLGLLAAAGASASVFDARGLRCRLEGGAVSEWSSTEPRAKLSTSVIEYEIRDIRIEEGYARLHGAAGTSDVRLLRSPASLFFLEFTPGGGVFLTTIFERSGVGSRRFPVVDSRHNPLLGDPVATQLHGWCEKVE